MSDTPSTPAGWYPAPHADNQQRYWDGEKWLDWTPEQATAAARQPATIEGGTESTSAGRATTTVVPEPEQPRKRGGLRWWAWVLIGLGAVILLVGIIGAINGGGDDDRTPATQSQEVDDDDPADESEEELVTVPNLVGMTVAEARAALDPLGVVLDAGNDDHIVTEQTIGAGEEVTIDELAAITLTSEPNMTMGQRNALADAQSYLDFTAFSRTGLIEQLEYEEYSTEDATWAADNAGADWNAEAAEDAQSYLDMTSFSRDGLAEQLAYEGYTPEQIEFALKAVGY